MSSFSKKHANDPCCQRTRRPLDDPFFAAGDRLVFGNLQNNGGLTFFCIEETPNHDNEDMMQHIDNIQEEINENLYPCPACDCVYESMAECESHYEERHVLICHVCSAVLSSEYLLDLHLQEGHDSFFAAAVEQRRALYKCLDPTCPAAGFHSTLERLNHLQSQHGYPKWFRFLPKSKLMNDGNSIDTQKKKKKWIKKKRHQTWKPSTQEINCEEEDRKNQNGTTCSTIMEVVDDTHKELKRQKRRDRQKLKRASVPCRFFGSVEGCWRGDSCMFLHTVRPQQYSGMEDNHVGKSNVLKSPQADINDLASELECKATINVPENISFGKRRKG